MTVRKKNIKKSLDYNKNNILNYYKSKQKVRRCLSIYFNRKKTRNKENIFKN